MRIDENARQVGMGYVPDLKQIRLLEGTTDTFRLLVEIIPVDSLGTKDVDDRILIDENGRWTAAGVASDDLTTIIPLSCDDIEGVKCLRIELL